MRQRQHSADEACTKPICHQCHHVNYPEDILQWVVHEGPRGPQKILLKFNLINHSQASTILRGEEKQKRKTSDAAKTA